MEAGKGKERKDKGSKGKARKVKVRKCSTSPKRAGYSETVNEALFC